MNEINNEQPTVVRAEETTPSHEALMGMATQLVSSYIAAHKIEKKEIAPLLQDILTSLHNMKAPTAGRFSAGRPVPAVPIQDSITDDHIICLEDGKKLKMIKRHLKAVYNMSVDEYRQRWGLPADYPAVAPNYAKKRSSLAKVIGLGVNGRRKKKAS